MKEYKVIVSVDAENALTKYLDYLYYVKQSPQSASNVLKDFFSTVDKLSYLASSLPEPQSEKMRELKLKLTKLDKHNYYLVFTVNDDTNTVVVTNIFHTSEDIENKIR